jgi:small subunit ribosomal protein S12
MTVTPKKPNSAPRKVARVRLASTGVEVTLTFRRRAQFAGALGGAHPRRPREGPSRCAVSLIRGAKDTLGVADRKKGRSKYGASA